MFDHYLIGKLADQIGQLLDQPDVPEELRRLAFGALVKPGRLLARRSASMPVTLTLLSFSVAAQGEPSDAMQAAAAMELLMAAGDLIDDVQDDEGPDICDRRTAGEVLEVLSLLLLLSHDCIAASTDAGIPANRVLRALRTLDQLGIAAIRGQHLDMRLECATAVSTELALECTHLKAASLTRCATEIGAVLGTDDERIVELLARFGWHFGILAQLMNDITAVWPGETDKSDIRLRKKTLPIVFSLSDKALCAESQDLVRTYYESRDGCEISEASVRKAIWRCGGIHYSWFIGTIEKAHAAQISREIRQVRPGNWSLDSIII